MNEMNDDHSSGYRSSPSVHSEDNIGGKNYIIYMNEMNDDHSSGNKLYDICK